jgi:acetyl-CoA carboxylase biotin carboxyl carrier protein
MKIGGRGPPFLDAELVRALAVLLTENGLTEIEYAVGDRRIRVARAVGGIAPLGGSSAPAAAAGLIEHPGAVKAPIVGTAYLAPEPRAPPFVRLGDSIVEGQPLLIIEAMKVMNQIRAHRPGRVAQILVADAQPVEYGAVLMLIE